MILSSEQLAAICQLLSGANRELPVEEKQPWKRCWRDFITLIGGSGAAGDPDGTLLDSTGASLLDSTGATLTDSTGP